MSKTNQLYGSHYIERQRSSGYKSTTYAMAEIVDNSVDASADNIHIILSEKETHTGNRSRTTLDRIFFVDDGSGMDEEILNTCLTFSEGAGKDDKRIGAFGVGLPNSSIAVCRRVEVYSKGSDDRWRYVFLDVDDQLQRQEAGYDSCKELTPNFPELEDFIDSAKSIVVWSNLDRLDVSKANTLISRSEKLLGRIYRYKIMKGLNITFTAFRQGKKTPIKKKEKVPESKKPIKKKEIKKKEIKKKEIKKPIKKKEKVPESKKWKKITNSDIREIMKKSKGGNGLCGDPSLNSLEGCQKPVWEASCI